MRSQPKVPVLLVDDDDAFREVYNELLSEEGYLVHEARDADSARSAFAKHKPMLVVLDLMLPPSNKAETGVALCQEFLAASPECKIVTVSGTGDTKLALSTVHRGGYDFLAKPVEPEVLFAVLKRAVARLALEERVHSLETCLASTDDTGLLGSSPPFMAARRLCERAAPTEVPVLITGATGTGKEVFARFLHNRSARSKGPFLPINCGALNANLLESLLFGHKKGAFTGAARDEPGLFMAATGGTLFLDEIGDTDPSLQVKLLRALEAKEVMAVGATKASATDVRVVSATHQDLQSLIVAGKFREDLFWRIRGIEVELPPLAERSGDLEVLAKHFLLQARTLVPGSRAQFLSSEVLTVMEEYGWPGNLRELRHEMQRAVVMAGDREEILLSDLSPNVQQVSNAMLPTTLDAKIQRLEHKELTRALQETGGNKTKAAEQLGLSRQGLLNKLARHAITS